ncbi:MAG TPA: heme ABC exporter ATP-binding protein CcmA [Rhizomicrobium sp.]|nr:heme ABC exporter ATP-binding protein CcmA [Rhizomicrobium sp.]
MIQSLTAEKLACARGERVLFEDLSFHLKAGQALAVEGANGAGKTSLLRLIAGFIAPRTGRVVIKCQAGEIADGEERGKQAGWLGHQDGLKPQLTVREQLSFFASLYDSKADRAAALQEVGLSRQADFPCRFLSAGQKRRLALARLLVCNRPLWLLDEPFAALDAQGQDLIARTMTRHCASGGMVIAATHDPLGLGNVSLRL